MRWQKNNLTTLHNGKSQMEAMVADVDVTQFDHIAAGHPCMGEVVSGDGHVFIPLPNGLLLGVIDVLGHGPEAHKLARHCEQWLTVNAREDIVAMTQSLHRELKGSRGAAMTLAYIDTGMVPAKLTVLGVGNTILRRIAAVDTSIPAQSGTIGQFIPTLRTRQLTLSPNDLLILSSDGITEHMDRDVLNSWRYWPLPRIASELLHQHSKWHDDAICLVLRHCP